MASDYGGRMPNKKKGPSRARKIRLTVIPKPEPEDKRSVLLGSGEGTVYFNGPDFRQPPMVCGACGAHLIEGMRRGQIDSVVLYCNACGAYNDTP